MARASTASSLWVRPASHDQASARQRASHTLSAPANRVPHGPRAIPATTWRERFGALRNVPQFLRLIHSAGPVLMVANLGLRLVRALLPVLMLYVGKLIIDLVIELAGAGHDFGSMRAWLASGVLQPLWWLLLLEFVLAVISDVCGRIVSLLDGLLSERYSNLTSVRLMEHAATLDLASFEDADLQDQLDRARRQSTGRSSLMANLFGHAQDIVTILSFAVGLAVLAPALILLLLVALLPVFLGEAHFNARSYQLSYMWTPERRELDYLRQTGASVETAKEVKIFGLNAFLSARYRQLAEALYDANRRLAMRRALWGSALTAVGTIGYYLAYAIIAWRTVRGDFSIGDLTFLAGSFRRLRGLLEGLLIGFSQTAGQALYLDDLFSFFNIVPGIQSPPQARDFPQPMRAGITFENVGFRYPGTQHWAVRNLDFHLQAGEVLALVGENGAGKTTLIKLLGRLYDPNEGRILLDGHDLREYDLDALRANIGVIFQDFVRYQMTASDNIAVGRIDAQDDGERIAQAARRSLADQVIEGLPGRYGQMIGRRFKDGVDLSGGQWQKVAIARAYMRDAQVLVLDEPTAALDARAEFEVFQRFKELSAGRTAVLISHRFSTVRMADRILVLENGRIAESGSHEELLAAQGRYAELFNLQAAGYR